MVSSKFTIKNQSGLHLRPAGLLCTEAIKYKSHISIKINNTTANAKSVLSVLGACIKYGDVIEIICTGEDEELAQDRILQLLSDGLGEKTD